MSLLQACCLPPGHSYYGAFPCLAGQCVAAGCRSRCLFVCLLGSSDETLGTVAEPEDQKSALLPQMWTMLFKGFIMPMPSEPGPGLLLLWPFVGTVACTLTLRVGHGCSWGLQ